MDRKTAAHVVLKKVAPAINEYASQLTPAQWLSDPGACSRGAARFVWWSRRHMPYDDIIAGVQFDNGCLIICDNRLPGEHVMCERLLPLPAKMDAGGEAALCAEGRILAAQERAGVYDV